MAIPDIYACHMALTLWCEWPDSRSIWYLCIILKVWWLPDRDSLHPEDVIIVVMQNSLVFENVCLILVVMHIFLWSCKWFADAPFQFIWIFLLSSQFVWLKIKKVNFRLGIKIGYHLENYRQIS